MSAGSRAARCAWHVLHNVSEWLRERLPGTENEGLRRGLLAGAQAVVNAPTQRKRRESLAVLREVAPWLADSLSLSLSRVAYPDKESPRTNNVCERGFRDWRRRIRRWTASLPMKGL